MAKKNKKEVEETVDQAVKHEEERRKAIADFNLQNMGKYWIDPDKIPTDEDIAKAKEEFETRMTALNEKKDYVIADKTNALRVAKFMKDFNDNSKWDKRMFVGVLNFSSLMQDFIDNFDEENPVDLVLEYMPVQYIFIVFENYGGVGIESARKMAEIWDEYLPIYEKLHELVDEYNKEAKMCEELKDKWAMFEQGYYVYLLEDTESDPTTVEQEGTTVPGDLTKE